ncbi:MAG: hypothetical protein RLZZ188_894 [Verrucomicrobiota bacterium]
MVLVSELSNTIDARSCVNVVDRSIAEHGIPEIFNTDQGCHFTSADFTRPMLARCVRLSIDGKDRALETVFVERF